MRDPRTRPDWRTVLRYAALQLPGQLFVGGLGVAAWEWFGAPAWLAWVAKDTLLFPFVWRAYGSDEAASAGLLGQIAVSDETLDPSGWARLGPELWRVELVPGSDVVPRGAKVRVVGVDGLLLRVAPEGAHLPGEAGVSSSSARSSSTQSS